MPSCPSGALYAASPIQLDKIDYILPLGNFTPLPSDHLYFVITRGQAAGTDSPVETVDLFSPGNVTVFQVGRQLQTTNGKVVNTDYFLSFAACREVVGAFGHVSSFAGPLSGIRFDHCDAPYSIGDASRYQHCTADVAIKLHAGQKIGTAGGKSSAALDFSNDDWRKPVPYIANTNHNYDLKATCAIDYYRGNLKAKLMKLLGHGGPGTHPIRGCGQIFQDKKGTLQGNWYHGTPEQANSDTTRMLSLAHDNIDPNMGAISVGGTIGQRGEWQFVPTHSGTFDRALAEVTPGKTIYCYQGAGLPGRILIQLTSETKLKIEEQSGSCTGHPAFVKPFVFQR